MSEKQTVRFRAACSSRYAFRSTMFERIEGAIGFTLVGGGLLGLVVTVISEVL